MKVICNRASLLEAVNLVASVAPSRSPKPQLQCVKIVAAATKGDATLTLSATDGEISLSLTLGSVEVEQPGEVLITAATLRQIVSAEDNEPTLTLQADGDLCHIRGADAHFQLIGYPPAEMPPLPDFDAVLKGKGGVLRTMFSQDAGSLDRTVARTVFATARENTRYAINGVLFKRDGKKLEMVATDGRRLALCRATITPAADSDGASTCIVPTKALTMLQKLLGNPEETVTIAQTDHQILFRLGSSAQTQRAVLSSNLVEGSFPPYEDVIPRDQDIKVRFDRDVLASAVRRAALLTNEESRGVRMAFDASDKQLELQSRAPEMGQATIRVDLAGYDGTDIEIGFNPAFILDALKVIDDADVLIELKDPKKPGLLKSGKDFLYVVMPVNLQ